MYSKPSDIPRDDEPGKVKKKKKFRMMVPDDLGDIVNAATSVRQPPAVAIPAQTPAPQQEFDLMGLLAGYQDRTEGSPHSAPPPPPPRFSKPQPERVEPPRQAQIPDFEAEAPSPKLAAEALQFSSTLSPRSKVFNPKNAPPQPPETLSSSAPNGGAATNPVPNKVEAATEQPPKAKQEPPNSKEPKSSSAAPTAPASKAAMARRVSRPNLAVPWKSRSLEEKKKECEAQPDTAPEKWSQSSLERSISLQKPTNPPGFDQNKVQPPDLEGAAQKTGQSPGFERPLQSISSAPSAIQGGASTTRVGKRGGEVPGVGQLTEQLKASWPSLGRSKAAVVTPQWVAKKEQVRSEEAEKGEGVLKGTKAPIVAAAAPPQWVIRKAAREEQESSGAAEVPAQPSWPQNVPIKGAGLDRGVTCKNRRFVVGEAATRTPPDMLLSSFD